MVHAMRRHPARRRVLQAADAQHAQMYVPAKAGRKARMGQQAVITEIDSQRAENVQPGDCQQHPVQLNSQGTKANRASR